MTCLVSWKSALQGSSIKTGRFPKALSTAIILPCNAMTDQLAGASSSAPHSTNKDAMDAGRQAALKQAGEEYLQKVLQQAREGKPLPSVPPSSSRRSFKDVERQDEDLETVGLVLEGSRLYVIGSLFFASYAARLVLAKVKPAGWFAVLLRLQFCGFLNFLCLQQSLEPLHTPAIQMFLHLLPAVCLTYALVDVAPLTGKALQASAVSTFLYGIQVRLALTSDCDSTEAR